MTINVPYTVDARPDSGLTNGKLGVWLFLASEVMLFGALLSAYILLRVGSSSWPRHELGVAQGALNTALLVASSVTMVAAWASLKLNRWGSHRNWLIVTFVLALAFVGNKGLEYAHHLEAGEGPWHSTFYAIYFALTGLHMAHIIGGMAVMAYFIGPGARLWRTAPAQFTNRIELTGLYWHFVDVVWLVLFPLLYLF